MGGGGRGMGGEKEGAVRETVAPLATGCGDAPQPVETLVGCNHVVTLRRTVVVTAVSSTTGM
jgi:hypothetical protein